MLSDQDKIERYDLIAGYFSKYLQKKADKLIGEEIYRDGWKQPRYMDETERDEEATSDFLSKMDDLGLFEFAELMVHEFNGDRVSENNQFYDTVYGDRATLA
jgi:hypothetical protein